MIFDFGSYLLKTKNRFLYLPTYLPYWMLFIFPYKSDFPSGSTYLQYKELLLAFLMVVGVCTNKEFSQLSII